MDTSMHQQQAGLTTNEKRIKTYKVIGFEVAVSRNRKSDKRMASAISHNNDEEPIVDKPQAMVVTSGSDDLMQSANHTATHSDSIEMVDQEERLRDLPLMLLKLAALNTPKQEPITSPRSRAFLRSPEISPRRRGSERANRDGRKTPVLGSNRVTSRTTPTSPVVSPLSSPRGSMIVIPDEINLSPQLEEIATLKPRKAVVLPVMPSPRQSLYDSAIAQRRVRNTSTPTKGRQMLCQSSSSTDCSMAKGQSLLYANDRETEMSDRAFLQRSITQQHRDIDGFLSELKEYGDKEVFDETVASLDRTVSEEEEKTVATGDETEAEEVMKPLEKVYLYQVQNQGDLMPDYLINHDAVELYGTGILNLRQERYVKDQPVTNFCFHCERVLIYTQVNHHRALTSHASDILYGVMRCRIYRDINLCKQCLDSLDLEEVIQIKPKAIRIFRPIYFAQ